MSEAIPEGREVLGAGAAGREGSPSRPADPRLAAGVFAALVVACVAALLVTQRLKHTPTPLERFQLTSQLEPAAPGARREERIAFELTKADRVTVTIEDSSGDKSATLVAGLPVGRYRTLSLRWNGRRGVARGYAVLRKPDGYTTLVPHNLGALAPPGVYTVRVELLGQKRNVPSPRTFELVGR